MEIKYLSSAPLSSKADLLAIPVSGDPSKDAFLKTVNKELGDVANRVELIGKSQILRTLGGLEPSDVSSNGTLQLKGLNLSEDMPLPEWRRDVAFVPQVPALEGTPREFYKEACHYRTSQRKIKHHRKDLATEINYAFQKIRCVRHFGNINDANNLLNGENFHAKLFSSNFETHKLKNIVAALVSNFSHFIVGSHNRSS